MSETLGTSKYLYIESTSILPKGAKVIILTIRFTKEVKGWSAVLVAEPHDKYECTKA